MTMTKIKFFKFIMDEIFPGGELPYIADLEKNGVKVGFDVTQVQTLRLHYARTLGIWAAALEERKEEAIAVQSEVVYDRYMKYLSGCAGLFHDGYSEVCQVTLHKS
jgi:cyclopropane-fatty-acyl-phospholipid synthase